MDARPLQRSRSSPTFDANDKVRLLRLVPTTIRSSTSLRAPMRLSTSPMSIEQFTIGFADVKPDRGSLYMALWTELDRHGGLHRWTDADPGRRWRSILTVAGRPLRSIPNGRLPGLARAPRR